MTEHEKMEKIRNSHEYATMLCNNMVVYYNTDGLVIAEHNANICEFYNAFEETFMTRYFYSGLASKVCQPDKIVRILTEFSNIKRGDFIKWLERPDKTDANCPVTYADVFIMDLFPYDEEEPIEEDDDDDDEPIEDDEEEPIEYEEEEENGEVVSVDVLKTGISLCIGAIFETILAIDRELARRNR